MAEDDAGVLGWEVAARGDAEGCEARADAERAWMAAGGIDAVEAAELEA